MSIPRNLFNKYDKQLLDLKKTGIDVLKTASKKLVHKAAKSTAEHIVSKIIVSNDNLRKIK